MTVAYETKDQEDEHSCFSDNTNADVVNNAKGIEKVYLGELPGGSDGPGLDDLVPRRTRARCHAARASSTPRWPPQAFPAPFEAMIAGDDGAPGARRCSTRSPRSRSRATTSAEVAKALGIQVTLEV